MPSQLAVGGEGGLRNRRINALCVSILHGSLWGITYSIILLSFCLCCGLLVSPRLFSLWPLSICFWAAVAASSACGSFVCSCTRKQVNHPHRHACTVVILLQGWISLTYVSHGIVVPGMPGAWKRPHSRSTSARVLQARRRWVIHILGAEVKSP